MDAWPDIEPASQISNPSQRLIWWFKRKIAQPSGARALAEPGNIFCTSEHICIDFVI